MTKRASRQSYPNTPLLPHCSNLEQLRQRIQLENRKQLGLLSKFEEVGTMDTFLENLKQLGLLSKVEAVGTTDTYGIAQTVRTSFQS